MRARIVVVHDDPGFTDALAEKLGPNVAWFTDPIKALMKMEATNSVAFLIARLQFTNGQPLGLSLARVMRVTRPDIRIVFAGRPEYRRYTCGIGEFIPEPVDASHVAMVIEWLDEQARSDLAAN
jgi:hypothetical protein